MCVCVGVFVSVCVFYFVILNATKVQVNGKKQQQEKPRECVSVYIYASKLSYRKIYSYGRNGMNDMKHETFAYLFRIKVNEH